MPVVIQVGNKITQRLGFDEDKVECPECHARFVPSPEQAGGKVLIATAGRGG